MVLAFKVRLMTHLEVIFVGGVKMGLKFIFFLDLRIQVFQHHLLKRLCFLTVMCKVFEDRV